MTVADNIFIGRPPMNGFAINDREMHRRAKAILDDLELTLARERLSRLSVAQQQMVEIAKAISYNSKILVLDEPSAALTEKEIQQLLLLSGIFRKRASAWCTFPIVWRSLARFANALAFCVTPIHLHPRLQGHHTRRTR